jgi:hypothetical protein
MTRIATRSEAAWGLVWVAALLATISPASVDAQSRGPGVGQATGTPADGGGLSVAEIVNRVRAAGYEPRSQPLQRGGVYFVFALDRHYMDVRVTVDANSGRVVSATRLAGARFGGPGYEGRGLLLRGFERPPVPPGEIPNRAARSTTTPAAAAPLPRSRPGEVVTGAVTEVTADPPAAPPPIAPAPAHTEAPAPPVSAPPAVAASPAAQPAMVPIAPLE